MGLEQVADLSAQLDTILKGQGLTQGSVGARLDQLNKSPAQLYANSDAGRAALLASLNQGNAAMQARLGRVFSNPPTAPLEIKRVDPSIQDGAPNGYYFRAPLDGSRPAIYWINLKGVGDWPKYTLPSLTYHEGVPGHHLQISTAQRAATHPLRKIAFFNAYLEGWALYAEQLADEIGGYATPVERAGYLQSFLFRAARRVADTGIHTKRWPHAQATDYFVNTVGFARGRSQREVERYCVSRGRRAPTRSATPRGCARATTPRRSRARSSTSSISTTCSNRVRCRCRCWSGSSRNARARSPDRRSTDFGQARRSPRLLATLRRPPAF